jgi:hypothetical protein|nr:MAG TPA: hypothetical protein [Caudoviricetes sp.]
MDFVWNLQRTNKQRKAMEKQATIQVNFEVHMDFAYRGTGLLRKNLEQTLSASLGLIGIRQLSNNGTTHTRWVGITTPYLLFKHLQAWRAFMQLYNEHAVAFAWPDGAGSFDGTLYAQEAYAVEWGCFNSGFFEEF